MAMTAVGCDSEVRAVVAYFSCSCLHAEVEINELPPMQSVSEYVIARFFRKNLGIEVSTCVNESHNKKLL